MANQGQESIISTVGQMIAAAVIVAVILPAMVVSIIIDACRKKNIVVFLFLPGFLAGCTLGWDWDKPFCQADINWRTGTGKYCDENYGIDNSDDAETETLPDQELPTTCQSYEKSCDGRCIDPDTDKSNCGGCGIACSATQDCAQGLCGCPSGTTACGNECYDFLTEVLACGGCGNLCEYPNAGASCENGSCQMGSCLENFYDCNNDTSNGCESSLKDLANCGACGIVCENLNAVSTCDGGTCEFLSCVEGFGDCDDDASNGCESDYNTDAGNCGGCGTVCGEADPLLRGCRAGICSCACGNGICDDELERVDCPQDCPYSPRCGDGYCDASVNEDEECANDCADYSACGISYCQESLGENFNTCSDCPDMTSVRGDGSCGRNENCQTSSPDCGRCNSCMK